MRRTVKEPPHEAPRECCCEGSRPPRGWALITGASSGLGRSLARLCLDSGWGVVLVARRERALRELAGELEAAGPAGPAGPAGTAPVVLPVVLDLADADAVDRLCATLDQESIPLQCITLVINNAGVGDHGLFLDLPADRMEEMIAVNVGAVTRLAHRFAPAMRPGAVICTVASVAAFVPGPLMAVYYATKAYTLSLGEALHQELKPRGVRVVTVCPGPFRSEFHARAGIGGAGAEQRLPSAEHVARRVMAAVRRGRAVAPVGAGSTVWAVVGPRLPRALARRFIGFLQARRR